MTQGSTLPHPSSAHERSAWGPILLLLGLVILYATERWVALVAEGMPEIDVVSWAVVVDLVFFVPLLIYLVAVRWLGWSWTVVVPTAIVGLVLSHRWVPAAKDGLLADLEWILIPIELMILGVIGWRARQVWRQLRREQPTTGSGNEVWGAIRRATTTTLGKSRVAEILGYELAVQVFALGFWRKPLPEPTATQFTVDRKSGFGLLMGGLAIATAAEIVPIHVLVHTFWSPTAAWVLTLISIYGGLFVLGHWQAVRRQPLELGDDALHFRLGLMWEVAVPYHRVASWRAVQATEDDFAAALRLVPAGRPSHLLEIAASETEAPLVALGPYGLRRPVERIVLHVDEPRRFEEALAARLDDR